MSSSIRLPSALFNTSLRAAIPSTDSIISTASTALPPYSSRPVSADNLAEEIPPPPSTPSPPAYPSWSTRLTNHDARSAPSLSLKPSSFKQKFFGRPTAIGSKFMGAGFTHAQEPAPGRGLPPLSALPARTSVEAVLAQSQELTQRWDKIVNTSLEDLPNTNQRPQRSKAMKVLTSVPGFKGLKPSKLQDVMMKDPFFETPATPVTATPTPAALGSDKFKPAIDKLLVDIQDCEQKRCAAEKTFSEKRVSLERARQWKVESAARLRAAQGRFEAHPSAQTRQRVDADRHDFDLAQRHSQHCEQAYIQAKQSLEAKTLDLHTAADIRNVMGAKLHSLTANMVSEKIQFVQTQMAQSSQQLTALQAELERERRQPIDEALQKLCPATQAIDSKADQRQTSADENSALTQALHDQSLKALVASPPGFSPERLLEASARSFRQRLSEVIAHLPADNEEILSQLPHLVIVEMLCRALAGVSHGEPKKADELLSELMSHSTRTWIETPEKASEDLRRLFQQMAEVPRGIEVLNLASLCDGSDALRNSHLMVVQAYWQADRAQKNEESQDIIKWLEMAKHVARHQVMKPRSDVFVFDSKDLEPKEISAFSAVLNGFLTTAPGSDYAFVNDYLLKLKNEWIDLAKDSRRKVLGCLPTVLNPRQHRTPFHPKTLKIAQKQFETQGIPTPKSKAHTDIVGMAKLLADRAQQGLLQIEKTSEKTSSKNDRGTEIQAASAHSFDLTTYIVADYIAHHRHHPTLMGQMRRQIHQADFHQTKRLYDGVLSSKDIHEIRQRIKKQGSTLHPFYEKIFQQKNVSVVKLMKEALHHIGLQSDSVGLDTLRKDMGIDTIDDAIDFAKKKYFDDPQDIITFFTPILQGLRMRDQIGLAGGSTQGLGLPLVPWSPLPPLNIGINVGLFAKKQESIFQIKNRPWATEISLGDATSKSHDFKGNVGLGINAGFMKLYLPSISGRFERNRVGIQGISLRSLRYKNAQGVRQEEPAIEETLALLDTIIRWNAPDKQPEKGVFFQTPLEALLALHPSTLVSVNSRQNKNKQFTADIGLAARAGVGPMNMGLSGSPLMFKTEKNRELGHERRGYAHNSTRDSSDQRRQRVVSALTVGMTAPFFKNQVSSEHPSDGVWRMNGFWNLLDVSRELAFNLEKNSVARFSIGDKTSVSLDRTFGSPKDLLAEIQAHREEFLIRCLEAFPRESADAPLDTPERRAHAESTLKNFERDLQLARDFHTLQYNINHELNPRMGGVIDGLRGIQAIAEQHKDQATVDKAQHAFRDILSFRASWLFKSVSIRSKGKDTEENGVDFFARLQRIHSAETSRVLSVYPY